VLRGARKAVASRHFQEHAQAAQFVHIVSLFTLSVSYLEIINLALSS
jgi:hypothetical protein